VSFFKKLASRWANNVWEHRIGRIEQKVAAIFGWMDMGKLEKLEKTMEEVHRACGRELKQMEDFEEQCLANHGLPIIHGRLDLTQAMVLALAEKQGINIMDFIKEVNDQVKGKMEEVQEGGPIKCH